MASFLPVSAGLHGCSLAFPSQSFLQRATRWKHFPKTPAVTSESWGQHASGLSRRGEDRTAGELRGGCVVEKRAEKGSSKGTGHKGKSPFSGKRLLQ